MSRSRLLPLILVVATSAPPGGPLAREEASSGGPEPIRLTLADCIRDAFKNNKEIQVTSYLPEVRENDLLFQKAQFDALLTASASYQDASDPSLVFFDENSLVFDPNTMAFTPGSLARLGNTDVVSSDSTQYLVQGNYTDRLHLGSTWSANLSLSRRTISALNFGFIFFTADLPEIYSSQLDLSFTQPLLRNFGRDVNETAIVVAANTRDTSEQNFKTMVLNKLFEVEDAYWTLVFARQDLEVRKRALGLAQELLKLNQIKVQVGTLPPIDITQAEAGVASREEAVITAEAAIQTAEDRLRRVMGMDPQSPSWKAPIVPVEDLSLPERPVDLDQEVRKAIDNRTDLASARLALKSADSTLAFRRNQMRYSLDVNATYTLQGLAGDTRAILADPNFGIPYVPPDNGRGIGDAFEPIPKLDFPTYRVSVTLGIPIGNRAEEAQYSSARLQREQAAIAYEDFEQAAIVQVGVAVRRVQTDRKRIEAAEKNRILQEKKVEAEQKKFENGLSTSFQVLTFQNDLAEALSAENQARVDYRISLANLDNVTGVLDQAHGVRIGDYARD